MRRDIMESLRETGRESDEICENSEDMQVVVSPTVALCN